MKMHMLRLLPLAASFTVMAGLDAQAGEYLTPNRYASPQYYPLQQPVQWGQPQEYAQLLGVSSQQQNVMDAAERDHGIAEKDGPEGQPAKTGWNYEVGAMAMFGPAYEGSDKYKVRALPTIAANYEDGLFFANIFDGIGSYLVRGEDYRLGASVGMAFGRDEKDDRKNLRGMGDIDMSPTANLLGEYNIGPVTLSGKLRKGDDEYGMTAEADIGTMFPVSDDLMLMAKAGAIWADEDHMNSYFGVSSAQSVRSGYGRYQAGSGIKSVGIDMGAFYALTGDIDAMLMVSADQLVGDAADSPLTRSDFQPSVFMGMSYKF